MSVSLFACLCLSTCGMFGDCFVFVYVCFSAFLGRWDAVDGREIMFHFVSVFLGLHLCSSVERTWKSGE